MPGIEKAGNESSFAVPLELVMYATFPWQRWGRCVCGQQTPYLSDWVWGTLHFNMPSTVEVNNNCYNKVMWMCSPSKYFGFALFVVLRQGLVQTGLKLQPFYLCLLSAGSVTHMHTRACTHTHTFSKAFTVLSLLVLLWNDTDLVMAWSKALSLVPGPDCVAWGTATKLTWISFFFLAVSQIESFLTKILAMQPMIFFFLTKSRTVT